MTPPVTHISPRAAALVAGCGFLIMAVLGVLVMVASIGYLTDSFANVLLSNYAEYETLILLIVAGPRIIGGLSLTFWLLFREGKRQPWMESEIRPAAGNTLGMEIA